MNRGIARRTLFDHTRDMEVFQDQLGAAVERGELEVHGYCLMGTHYHLLVRSPDGRLATAMQRVQTEYSRWFNRSRKRDGTLVRGRYRSRPIESLSYRRAVVAYIDRNPVSAGITTRAEDYPFGSAREYCGRGASTRWLERSWVESVVIGSLDCRPSLRKGIGRSSAAYPTRWLASSRRVGALGTSRILWMTCWLRHPVVSEIG